MVRDDALLTEPRFAFGSFNREDTHVLYLGVVLGGVGITEQVAVCRVSCLMGSRRTNGRQAGFSATECRRVIPRLIWSSTGHGQGCNVC